MRLLSHGPQYTLFPPKFRRFIVSSFSWILEAHAIFVGGGETRKFKGNVEVDKRFLLSLFRRDLVIIIIIIEMNVF